MDDRGVAPLLDVDPKAEGGDGRSIAESTCVRVRKQVGNLNHLSPLCSATRLPGAGTTTPPKNIENHATYSKTTNPPPNHLSSLINHQIA